MLTRPGNLAAGASALDLVRADTYALQKSVKTAEPILIRVHHVSHLSD
ncbi:hypothetical protein PR003_g9527 [Phytophthora rubi]|uniref:Uncharacterized protein n=1 Tax=Phytophthora rubi TaxID=129364 RepID=A0A6A4FG40_9STRA|nr:hypothetical protein PR002_g9655 [Phytophthora rubi]KAE9342338.1 hypothetical protein PR003_g9527 [Phytophthora rubi]